MKLNFAYLIFLTLFAFFLTSNSVAEDKRVVKPKAAAITAHNQIGGSTVGQFYINSQLDVLEEKEDWSRVKLEAWVKNSSIQDLNSINNQRSVPVSSNSLEVTSHKIQSHGEPINKAYLTLSIKNNTDQSINSWKAFLVVKSRAGSEVYRTVISDDQAKIEPGAIKETGFNWGSEEEAYKLFYGSNNESFSFALDGAILK